MNKFLLLCSVVAAMAACRDDNSSSTDAPPSGDSVPGATKVADVQNDALAPNSPVTLKNVVVTAIDKFGAKVGNIFVADAAGGPFSGILVFGAPAAQVDALAVGDIVTIEGAMKVEFALADDMSGRKTTELSPVSGGQMMITKTGTGAAPAPAMVDAAAIAALDQAGQDAEWEKWEGVLIKVVNVSALTSPRMVGTTDATFLDFTITGNARVDSSLAALPEPAIKSDDCLASVTGMGDYFFNYKILPRATADIVTGGTSCPLPEKGAAACMDGIDNDLDGFKDCLDFSCTGDPTSGCAMATTVAMIQNGTIAANSNVALADVFVTARDRAGKGLWVADALAGADNNGVYVYLNAVPDATFVVGAKVSLIGLTTEFDVGNPAVGNTLTEIKNAVITLVAAPAAAPTPLTSTAGVAGDITNGEPQEGVLTKIVTLKVMAVAGTGTAAKVTMIDNAAKTILMYQDAGAFAALPVVGQCLDVTGIMSLDLGLDKRTINPRSAADLVTGAGCN